jgi:hypothetical protein
MKSTYKAVEVSAPGGLRVVERSVTDLDPVRFGFGLKYAEFATPMPQRSEASTRV